MILSYGEGTGLVPARYILLNWQVFWISHEPDNMDCPTQDKNTLKPYSLCEKIQNPEVFRVSRPEEKLADPTKVRKSQKNSFEAVAHYFIECLSGFRRFLRKRPLIAAC